MSAIIGRVFTGLPRVSLSGGILIRKTASTVSRVNSVQPLALSSKRLAWSRKPPGDKAEENNEPIKFSTSKASHRVWKVEQSMGSDFQQPWWKVLTVSLFTTTLLLWCVLRENTDIDAQLDAQLYEHVPSLISDEEEAETQNKSS